MTNRKKFFFVEDDENLKKQARPALTAAGYDIVDVEVRLAMDPNYWKKLEIKTEDAVGLDLNFTLADVSYSGLEMFSLLSEERQKGELKGLVRVLVQTSIAGQISGSTVHPDFVIQPTHSRGGFDVGAYEKSVNPVTGQVLVASYRHGLVRALSDLYAGRNLLND